jgi:hypothetical protein
MLIFNSSKPDISNLVTTGHFYFGLTYGFPNSCCSGWYDSNLKD